MLKQIDCRPFQFLPEGSEIDYNEQVFEKFAYSE